MPRMEEDTNIERVKHDVEEYNIRQPLGLDHQHAVAERFENEYVPAFFIFGKDGTLSSAPLATKGFQKVEPKIREALGLPPESTSSRSCGGRLSHVLCDLQISYKALALSCTGYNGDEE